MGRAGGGGSRSSGGHSASAGRSSGGRSFGSGRSSSNTSSHRSTSISHSSLNASSRTPSHSSSPFGSPPHSSSSPSPSAPRTNYGRVPPPPPHPVPPTRPPAGSFTPPPPPPPRVNVYHSGEYHTPPHTIHTPPPPSPRPQRCRRGCFTPLMVVGCVLILIFVIGLFSPSSGNALQSTVQRERLETSGGFDSDCIVDELGWISNKSQVTKSMKYFWEKTEVQPVIYLKEYDPSLRLFEMTRTEQDFFLCGDGSTIGWLDEWFEDSGYSESTYVFVYFDGPESGELYDDHYQFYTVPGRQVGPVMDSEAEDIFYSYLESYWQMDPGEMSEDEMFSKTWENTADRIMDKTTTQLDAAKYAVGFGILVFVVYAAFKAVKLRRQHERERNEEAAQILNADIHSNSSESDDMLDRWP